MAYRCVAGSMVGLVQQVACNYLPHGYWFYVMGTIPEGKDAEAIDQKLIQKYKIDMSRQTRARQKRRGRANIHYVRFEDQFILLATRGRHLFFEEEKGRIQDARKVPIRMGGYSLMCRKDELSTKGKSEDRYRVRVQICREVYREWRDYFVERAPTCSAERLERELYNFPYEPYAPVRRQVLTMLRLVNKVRSGKGLERLDWSGLRYRRRVVKPFECGNERGGSRVVSGLRVVKA